eukprot:COSAG06_NODE_1684_length_8722_cov_3.925896_3_plen_131_part_00
MRWRSIRSLGDGGGGLAGYRGGLTAGPLVLYGPAPAVGLPPAVVAAPLDDYKNVIIAQPRPNGQVVRGAQGFLDPLPASFTTRIGVLGRRGIAAAMYSWGDAAKAVAKTRKAAALVKDAAFIIPTAALPD